MRESLGSFAIALAIATGCAPAIDGPLDRQRAIDRDDGDRLAAQLARLPGVVTASVALHHALRDPLAAAPPAPATLAAVITTDDTADPGAIRAAADRLARAAVPELPGTAALPIEILAIVRRPVLAQVGPFRVERSSRAPLEATLVLGCLVIAGLATRLAFDARRARRSRRSRDHRRGNSPQ